jgi:sugar lactone lactonase YvrE
MSIDLERPPEPTLSPRCAGQQREHLVSEISRDAGRRSSPRIVVGETVGRPRRTVAIVIGVLLAVCFAGIASWRLARTGRAPVRAVAEIALDPPSALAIAPSGTLLVSNSGTNQILRYEATKRATIAIAGNGKVGFAGDGGSAVDAELNQPGGITVAADGTIYIADTGNNRIRAITGGLIRTVAGGGYRRPGLRPIAGTAIALLRPSAVAIGPNDTLYFCDDRGVYKLTVNGDVTRVLRGGPSALKVDGVRESFLPDALAFDGVGNLYVGNSSPRDTFEIAQNGAAKSLRIYVTPAGLSQHGTSVLVGDYGNFSLDRIQDGRVTTVISFIKKRIPGLNGVFRPSGAVEARNGIIYAVTNGANGGTNEAALISISPDGTVHLLT